MITEFAYNQTILMVIFVGIAIAIPALVMYFDDSKWDHHHPQH